MEIATINVFETCLQSCIKINNSTIVKVNIVLRRLSAYIPKGNFRLNNY